MPKQFSLNIICILIQNLQTYQYIVTYILGTQMEFRRNTYDTYFPNMKLLENNFYDLQPEGIWAAT